jgi:hypothetical protein
VVGIQFWPQSRHTLAAVVLVAGAAGCSSARVPKGYPVSGKVVYKGGRPATQLRKGFVHVVAAADPSLSVAATIEDDATFYLAAVVHGKDIGGLPAGEYQARVMPPKGHDGNPIRGLLDPRYEKVETSGLRFSVVAGDNPAVTLEVSAR